MKQTMIVKPLRCNKLKVIRQAIKLPVGLSTACAPDDGSVSRHATTTLTRENVLLFFLF